MKRIKRYCPIDIITIRARSITKTNQENQIKKIESEVLLEKTERNSYTIALDCRGSTFDSMRFASLLSEFKDKGMKVNFLIGGPLGLSAEVLDKAKMVLSLSKMTFTHDMVRIFLLEQIYRAFTILNNEKYHK